MAAGYYAGSAVKAFLLVKLDQLSSSQCFGRAGFYAAIAGLALASASA
mgnify:CR=1 FL=1